MMEELCAEVRAIAEMELKRANAEFPPFHSLHEGYAVLREELDEATDAMNKCIMQSGNLWTNTKANELEYAMKTAANCRNAALNVACEAIQCAAMCDKILALSKTTAQTPQPAKAKKTPKQKAEEKAMDEACVWVTKNVPDKKWPCGPDGEQQSREKCLRCVKLYQNAIKEQEDKL